MKALIVTPYFYPHVGGVENYVLSISKGLHDIYHWEIVIVTTHSHNSIQTEMFSGLKIYKLPYWFKISNTPINPFWYFTMKRIIQKEDPDVISAHTPVPFISDITARIAYKLNIPFILTYHNDLVKDSPVLNSIIKLYYVFLGNKSGSIAKVIIATSLSYAKASFYLKKFQKKVKIIPPGVDTSIFTPVGSIATIKDISPSDKIVLFVGQLDKTHSHKGLSYLISAIAKIKKTISAVKLVVVGTGDNLEEYKQQVRNEGIINNTVFSGFVMDKDLPSYYRLSNVVVLPSYNNSEGFGMVLIEAGACGKPVIGSNVGGIPYVIDNNKTGLLITPKDSTSLASAVISILTNDKFARELGENGYEKIIKDFTWGKQIKNTNDIFMKAIKK